MDHIKFLALLLTVLLLHTAVCEEDYEYEEGEEEISQIALLKGMFEGSSALKALAMPILNNVMSVFAPVSDGVQNQLCKNHSKIFIDSLKNGTLWAIKMFDSSTKIPDGIAAGNYIHLGNFDECVNTEVDLDESLELSEHHFSGQQCAAIVGLSNGEGLDTDTVYKTNSILEKIFPAYNFRNLMEVVRTQYNSSANNVHGFPLPMSLCIPSSCKPEDLEISIVESFGPIMKEFGITVSTLVHEDSCQTNKKAPMDQLDYAILWLIVAIFLLTVASTAYDLYLRKSKKKTSEESVLMAFSVCTNTEKLLAPKPSSDVIGCLDGLRVLTMLWVVMGHRNQVDSLAPIINPQDVYDATQHWYSMVILNATFSVDGFLLLSGLLLTYLFLNRMQKGTPFNIFKFYIYRYLRLTPTMAMMVALTSTLFYQCWSGPLWKFAVKGARDHCRSQWWTNMLYVNNYVKTNTECAPHTWYLAVDMQLFWISPFILIPLWKWPVIGVIETILLAFLSASITFWITFTEELPWTPIIISDIQKLLDQREHVFNATPTRAAPYFVGMLLGYILFKTKGKKIKLSKITVALGWLASTVVILVLIFSIEKIYKPYYVYDSIESAIYASSHRLVYAICVSWVIFACVHGYGGPVNKMLSLQFFQPLSTLTYSTYLTNIFIMMLAIAPLRVPLYRSDYISFHNFFGDAFLGYVVAYIFYLLFEAPVIVLIKFLLEGGGRKKQKDDAEDLAETWAPEHPVDNDILHGHFVTEKKDILMTAELHMEQEDAKLDKNKQNLER